MKTMIQEINKDDTLEMFKRGTPLKALTVKVNSFSVTGSAGCELLSTLTDLDEGVFQLTIQQIGVPELRPIYYAFIDPTITINDDEIKIRDKNYMASFKPILE